MATGPEHYREAERILAAEVKPANDPDRVIVLDPESVAVAQVHATLALAAAVAGLDATEGPGGGSATGRERQDAQAWSDAGAVTL